MIRFDRLQAIRGVAQSFAAALIATLIVTGLIACTGRNPIPLLMALIQGPITDPYRFAESLARACPLMLCGLAVAVAFRAQAWNIGVEGQYLLGAIAATFVGLRAPAWPAPVVMAAAIVSAALAGAIFALPAILLERTRRVSLVLSTILLNFTAVSLVSYLTQGPLRGSDPSAAQTDPIPVQLHLPVLLRATDLHAGFILAACLAVFLWAFMRWSRSGFHIRVAGLNPVAAEWSGLHVGRIRVFVMLVSGGIGGLAGGIQVLGVTHLLNIQASEGFGYVAIAVALLGRLHPLGVGVAAIFMGMLDVGASHVERLPELGVPADIAQVIKGVLVLVVLVMTGPHWQRMTARWWARATPSATIEEALT